jgi:hypothetical protein
MKIVIAFTCLLAGCATQKAVYLPDGRQGYSINCSGPDLNWGMCYEKAGEVCKSRGYDVISKTGDQGSSVVATQYGVIGGTKVNRSLLIACK